MKSLGIFLFFAVLSHFVVAQGTATISEDFIIEFDEGEDLQSSYVIDLAGMEILNNPLLEEYIQVMTDNAIHLELDKVDERIDVDLVVMQLMKNQDWGAIEWNVYLEQKCGRSKEVVGL